MTMPGQPIYRMNRLFYTKMFISLLLSFILLSSFALAEYGTAMDPFASTDYTTEDPDGTIPDVEPRYILNNNTMKFHYPDCSSVKMIKDKNRGESILDREELIAMGYSQIGRAHF